jgi:methylthioribose-1-phosphate isomerase
MDSALDDHLPFLLRRQNVARYEDGVVIIGDRRKYPFERAFKRCEDVESVARAIEDMVTQGGGPWVAAVYALAMAAHQVDGETPEVVREQLERSRARLVATRPTNSSLPRLLARAMSVVEKALASDTSLEQTLLRWIEETRDVYYARAAKVARFGAELIDDGDGVLTMCFAETTFILSLSLAQRAGKRVHAYTPETRPYLQGARLTAPCLHELGIPVQIITDNMPAYILSQGKIRKYFTAADLVTLDGHIVNKIGTFQNALSAHHHGVPYFVLSMGPDPERPNRDSIVIEERDPAEIRSCRGVPTTIEEIEAYYPAFDITPPHLVAGIVTEHGILSPYDLARYYGRGNHQ